MNRNYHYTIYVSGCPLRFYIDAKNMNFPIYFASWDEAQAWINARPADDDQVLRSK